MTDAEIIDQFLVAERRWLGVLAEVRAMHERALGKRMTPVQWLPESGHGSCGWLGYYWMSPPFWFGYGRRAESWSPLIECDVRRCGPVFVLQLEANLPSTWKEVDRLAGCFWRLWAPPDLREAQEQTDWLSERSRELHEFSVVG
jgi:hypothetical protein